MSNMVLKGKDGHANNQYIGKLTNNYTPPTAANIQRSDIKFLDQSCKELRKFVEDLWNPYFLQPINHIN
jgi:hypothetical protein